MSRGQENQVVNEAQSQNATNAANAQTSYNAAQADVGNYQGQLAKFAAANPYGEGGAYQTDQNKVLAQRVALLEHEQQLASQDPESHPAGELHE